MARRFPRVCPVIIGRERELATLREAVERARGHHSQVIFLSGEAGIGKSRLVDEIKQTAIQTSMTVFQGNCFEQDRSFPFSLWVEGMRSTLANTMDLRPGTNGKANSQYFRQLIAPFAPDFIKLLPEITDLLPNVVPSPALDSEAEKHRLFETWGKFFTRLSQGQPLLMVLEDLHWSDDISLDLLQFLARRIVSYPILMIATYRDDEITPHLEHVLAYFDRQRLAQEIRLEPLSREDSYLMIQKILENERPVRGSVLDQILSYSQGNPFYIEELVKQQVDSSEGDRKIYPLVSRSLRETIQRRMVPLSTDTKQILTFAAIIGERFSFALLWELTHLPDLDLLQHLHELVAASILTETSTGEFSFRHALIREAVYASLLVPERQNLHLRVAETIEKLYQNQLEIHLAQLAYHYYEAGAWQKALEYGQLAGQSVLNLAAMREALAHFTRAIDAARHLAIQPTWQLFLAQGKVYDMLGDANLARVNMAAALDQARSKRDQRGEWEALINLGFLSSAHDYDQSITIFQQALQVARAIGEPALIGATLNRIGNWFANQDRPAEAGQYHQEALQIYEELQDRKGMAHTLELTAIQTYFLGDILKGGEACERALSIFRSLEDREGIFYSLLNSQLNYTFDNDITPLHGLALLKERGEEALHIAQTMGWRSGEADALHISALVARASGDYDLALRNERLAVMMNEEINHRTSLSRALMNLGMIHLDLLAFNEAIQVLEHALQVSQETGSRSISIVVCATLAQAFTERGEAGDFERATRILQGAIQSLPVRTRHERYGWIARARMALAFGEATEALQIADSLLSATYNIESYGPQGVPRLAHLRGDALATLGQVEEARQMYSAAREGSIRQERRGILWRTLLSMGGLALSQKQWAEAESAFTQTRAVLMELAEPISDEMVRVNFLQRGLEMIPAIPAAGIRDAVKQAFGGLTGREREIAALIAGNRTNRQIAQKLFISERTVERHVSNILLKLNFHTRGQVAEWAGEHLVPHTS